MNLGPEPHGRLGKAPSMVELDDGCFFACWWAITLGFWGRFMMFNYGQVGLPISAWCCQMSLVGFVLAELDTTPASAKSSAELPRITPSRNRDAGTEYTPLLPQPSADNNVLEKTWAIWVQQNITKLKQLAQNLGQTLGCKSPCRNFSFFSFGGKVEVIKNISGPKSLHRLAWCLVTCPVPASLPCQKPDPRGPKNPWFNPGT